MLKINEELISKVTTQSMTNNRKRKNYNFHSNSSDMLQRMLNALEPGTYVQPHKHESPDKREVFIILKGKALIVEFDNDGNVTENIILDALSTNYGVEIAPKIFHTIISLETGTVVYELKDGPYFVEDDKNFATWAPGENTVGCNLYLNNLIENLGITLK